MSFDENDPGPLDSYETVYGATTLPPGQDPASGIDWTQYSQPGESYLQKLLQKYGLAGQRGADIAKLLGSFSSGEKANRVIKGQFAQNFDRLKLSAQEARNANESDALSKLGQTSYIMGGGSKFKAPTLSINGKTYNTADLGYGPVAPSDAEKEGAAALQAQLKGRLRPGGSYEPTSIDDYADPGLAENIGSYGAVGTGILSQLMSGQDSGGSNGPAAAPLGKAASTTGEALSIAKMAGLGSKSGVMGTGGWGAAGSGVANAMGRYLVPGVGAAAGIYGLAQNNGTMSNVLSGAGTGASIGTMIAPGIGTLVGGGIGAGYGALQSAFTVTKKEHEGRDLHSEIVNRIDGNATPAELEEAKNAGWADPKQALSLIVIRDTLINSGMDPVEAGKKAEAIKKGMYEGEKHGTKDVAKAASPIAQFLG